MFRYIMSLFRRRDHSIFNGGQPFSKLLSYNTETLLKILKDANIKVTTQGIEHTYWITQPLGNKIILEIISRQEDRLKIIEK